MACAGPRFPAKEPEVGYKGTPTNASQFGETAATSPWSWSWGVQDSGTLGWDWSGGLAPDVTPAFAWRWRGVSEEVGRVV